MEPGSELCAFVNNAIHDPIIIRSSKKDPEIGSILSSNKSDYEKELFLNQLIEFKMNATESEVRVLQYNLNYMGEIYAIQARLLKSCEYQRDSETVLKLHYKQVLTLRTMIKMYEDNLGLFCHHKNCSRVEEWSGYFNTKLEKFKPFQRKGFSAFQVATHVDRFYTSSAGGVLSTMKKDNLQFDVTGLLNNCVAVLILETSAWKDFISVSNNDEIREVAED